MSILLIIKEYFKYEIDIQYANDKVRKCFFILIVITNNYKKQTIIILILNNK